MSKHETIVLREGTKYWYTRTQAELDAMRAWDIGNGRSLDDAGEPRLYWQTGADILQADTLVTVTRLRGIDWRGAYNKPRYLAEGVATIEGLPRIIMFVRRPKGKL